MQRPDDAGQQIAELFRREVPEVAAGTVQIKSIARRAGVRTKVAVTSRDPAVDAVEVCVGPKAERVTRIAAALAGESIDIVNWSESTERMVRTGLAPTRIVNVELHPDTRTAVAFVRPEDLEAVRDRQLNRDLASELVGWEIELAPMRT